MANLFSHGNVGRSLRIRLALFLVIGLVIVGIIARDVWHGDLVWWLAIIGVVAGAIIGTVLGRLLTITWHETEEQAVSQMDIAGGIGIALYIVLDLSRNWLLGYWVSGLALSTLSLAVLGGALVGRYLGMAISIRRVLDANVPEA